MNYYELLQDGTIGRSTTFQNVAKASGLTLTTDEEIVNAWDGKRYLVSQVPPKPEPTIAEKNEAIRATREMLFSKEADPLRLDYEEFLARYGDADSRTIEAKTLWLAKKDEIRGNNPYQVELIPETQSVPLDTIK